MLVKVWVFIFLGCDLEPQSNEPYLATSLQDFWGRRWNLMVPAILRPAVYNPVQRMAEWKMSSDHARFLAVLATFLVSGAVHEQIFYYINREMPTGEITWFFVLHGICTAAEVLVKKRTFVGGVEGESDGFTTAYGRVCCVDQWMVVFPSSYKGWHVCETP
ncbi:unnamed protein product [Brassica napus]|uniref:(rape) hypothetical protein n=1 Tax=Brassica napus TaxID=3708 RepID=A0A816J1L1_BRANA|nr:unnamed protein product [Brassica napus]